MKKSSKKSLILWKKKLIDRKYFVYFGSRAHEKSIVKKKFLRDILGNIMRFFVYTVLNIKIKDTQCGYKLYKKKISKLVFSKLKSSGFDHDLEIILFLKSKYSVFFCLSLNESK